MILIIDNYDSFVHNLARYFRLFGCDVKVVRNDQITADEIEFEIEQRTCQAIVMSPGPCSPNEAGICLEVAKRFAHRVPILGVCLGHQVLAQALGGKVVQWDYPIHGKADYIYHDGEKEFLNLPNPFLAGRYHSLAVLEIKLPSGFVVSARLKDGTVMAIRHRKWPLYGFQFHPESILTQPGMKLIEGFLRETGITHDRPQVHREITCEYPNGCRPITDRAESETLP